jgi:hypothetical protein
VELAPPGAAPPAAVATSPRIARAAPSADAPGDAAAAAPTDAASSPSAPADPTITEDGVGPLRVGRMVPERFRDRALLRAAYVTTFYSDAQPLEGFTFDDPPVTVYVRGAFHDWGYAHPGQSAPERVRAATIEAAIAGHARVEMIVVRSPRLKTARGIAAGDSIDDFRRAYPALTIGAMPALWEEPSHVALMGKLVFFFTPTRDRVLRIVIMDKR